MKLTGLINEYKNKGYSGYQINLIGASSLNSKGLVSNVDESNLASGLNFVIEDDNCRIILPNKGACTVFPYSSISSIQFYKD